jgi:phosphodiesterase/alkaline phosphatase D-like protein
MAGTDNARAEHDDERLQERRQKYGDMADLTVDELQQRAKDQGIKDRSKMDKDELLQALSSGR